VEKALISVNHKTQTQMLTLTNTPSSNYVPPPEGIHSAVCVDVIDLGIQDTEFGPKHKLRLTFELEAKQDDGSPFKVSKSFTASLHPKATLAGFISKWRGKPVADGESINLEKLIGASATLVLGTWQNGDKSGVGIDAISKPTKKLSPSGSYDPAAARQRIAEYAAKQGKVTTPATAPVTTPAPKAPTPKPAAAPDESDDIPF
jgi:hypothetical protein